LRYRIFMITLLALVTVSALVILPGCNKAEAKDQPEETSEAAMAASESNATDFFIGLEDVLTENSLASIAIIEILDPKNNDEHRIRNVRQATMAQLSQMVGIAVREVSHTRVDEVLGELKGTASTGLNPEDVMSIGIELGVDALLFASIESKDCDVFFWAYSAMSGDVIFSDTLQTWQLPVGGSNGLGIDLSDLDLGS